MVAWRGHATAAEPGCEATRGRRVVEGNCDACAKKTIENARQLRRVMTLPEVVMWAWLRSRPFGLRFRRQHPIGRYIADFYCPAHKLIIEIDGIAHDMGENPRRDAYRDDWLKRLGFRVVRIPAADVLDDFDAVVRMILWNCGD